MPQVREGATVRFIHTADLQLGMARQFLDADAGTRYAQARIDVLRTIARVAADRGAQFVIAAGDVFETNRVGPRTVRRALEAMGEIQVPVLLLPGNHDPLDAGSVYRSPTFERSRPANVVVLDGKEPVRPVPGVEVLGAPWMSKRPLQDLVNAACSPLEPRLGIVRVVVGHGVVDQPFQLDNPAAIRLADLEDVVRSGCVQYVALGDRHSKTDIGSTGRIWYSGSPEPTAYDETEPGFVLLADVDHETCTVTPEPVAAWRFVQETFELHDDADLDTLAKWFQDQAAKDRTVVRLTLAGMVSLSQHARLQALIDEAREVFGAVEDWDPTRELLIRPEDDDFADLRLTGFAQKAVEHLREIATTDGPDRGTAREALALLVRQARRRAEA